MTDLLLILAQDKPAQPGAWQSFLPFILIIVIFYFLMIRPQQRQRKELQNKIAALQTGDRVVTTAGIHAIVHSINEKTLTLKIADGIMVKFDKEAVMRVEKKSTAEPKAS